MGAALAADWNTIRTLAQAGTPLRDLAKQTGISAGTLAARSAREGWQVAIKTAVARRQAAKVAVAVQAGQMQASASNGSEITANAIAANKAASLTALSSVTAKIARKWDTEGAELPEPEKVNQLASAHAKLHPGEKAEVNVSLNIAAFFG